MPEILGTTMMSPIHHLYLPEPASIESDRYGRHFMEYTHQNPTIGKRRYLVPFSAVDPDAPLCRQWMVHDRHRIAVPENIGERKGIVQRFNGPEHGGRSFSWIFLIEAESRACAELIALASGVRIGGWGTGTTHDCSGRSFANAADNFIVRNWDERKPGARHRHRTYGFFMSSDIDC